MGLNRTGLQKTGGNHTVRNIMMCTAHHMLGCNISRECDGQGM